MVGRSVVWQSDCLHYLSHLGWVTVLSHWSPDLLPWAFHCITQWIWRSLLAPGYGMPWNGMINMEPLLNRRLKSHCMATLSLFFLCCETSMSQGRASLSPSILESQQPGAGWSWSQPFWLWQEWEINLGCYKPPEFRRCLLGKCKSAWSGW